MEESINIDQTKYNDKFSYIADGKSHIHSTMVVFLVFMILFALGLIGLAFMWFNHVKNLPDERDDIKEMLK